MTKRAKREISLFQYILTISGVQVGFGVLTLPREVAQGANTDGWISIIIGCAITTLVSLCIVKIMEKTPWVYFTRCANSLSWEVARKSRNDFLDFICCPCSYFLNFFPLIRYSHLDFT